MNKVIIEIETENEAFGDDPVFEICRILDTIARHLEYDDFENEHEHNLHDINGNTVGKITFE